jgi:hypothetical protein
MHLDESELDTLSDIELRDHIRVLELEIAACEARINPDAEELKRSRRLGRGTFLMAAGFLGLSLDPISALVAVVGFFDWVEALRDDAAQANSRSLLRRQSIHLKTQLALLENEVERRTGEKAR